MLYSDDTAVLCDTTLPQTRDCACLRAEGRRTTAETNKINIYINQLLK